MITPANPFFEQQWHLKVIKAEEAWQLLRDHSAANGIISGHVDDKTFGDAKVYIAVIDQGLQETGGIVPLPDLQGNVTDGHPKAGPFYDFLTTTTVPGGGLQFQDDNNVNFQGSHGMYCAGVAAAKAAYSDSSTPGSIDYQGGAVTGVAPNCPVIGIIDFYFKGQFIWLLNIDPGIIGEILPVPPGNFLNNYAPFNSGDFYVDVINTSLAYWENNPADNQRVRDEAAQVAYYATVFGRGGRGMFLAASAGNQGGLIKDFQNLAYNVRYNIIGATALPDNSSSPFHVGDEIRASYSNYGDELHFVAPAGDNQAGLDAYQILTTALHDGGTIDTVPDFTIDLNNPYSDSSGGSVRLRLDVTSAGGCRGLFAGQFISPVTAPVESQRILEVDEANNQIWIGGFKFRTTAQINNLEVAVSTKYTQLSTSNPNPSSDKINVTDTTGFQDGQRLFIGDVTAAGNGEFATIDIISGNEITIDGSTPDGLLSHSYPAGTPVIAGEIRAAVQTDTPNPGAAWVTLPLDTVQGFFKGMQVLLNGTFEVKSGVSYQDLVQKDLQTVVGVIDDTAKTIDVLAPTGDWRTLRSGVTLFGIGYGDYNGNFSGTSAASPVVSGGAALVHSANYNLSWLEVREILGSTADKIDLSNTAANGRWKDIAGHEVFDGYGSFQIQLSGKTLGAAANLGDEQITVAPDNSGFVAGMVISIEDNSIVEYAVVEALSSPNILHLDRPLRHSFPSGKLVKGGRVAFRSNYYGRGRINLKKAVEAALDYDHNACDLMIRNTVGDTGLTATDLAAETIDSPDIWVRNVRPDLDGGAAIPPNDANPTHQNPGYFNTKWVYVRIKNRGNALPSLANTQIRFSILFTDSPDDPFLMPFPEFWGMNTSPAIPGGHSVTISNITPSFDDVFPSSMYTPGSGAQLLFDNPPVNQADWRQPQQLPPIAPGDDYIAILPWPGYIGPSNDNFRTFLRVHLTPFDGELAGSSAADNHHLTYKEIVFSRIRLLDPAGAAGTELTEVEVNVSGTVLMRDTTIELTQLEPGAVDRIEITATMQFADGTPDETAVFSKISGSWAFDSALPWLVLDPPVLSGAGAPFQETTHFGGTLALSNAHAKLTLHVRTTEGSGSTLLEREMTVAAKPVIPRNAGGIGRQQTLVMQTFTDFDLLPPQSGANNFGPVSETQFRTSAMFSGIVGSPPRLKAYAMAPGWACLREVDGEPDLLNLIFKPDKQNYIPYGKVKYFIYRGLKKSGFLDASGDVLDAAAADNELLQRMWEVRDRLNDDERALDPGFVDIPLTPADLGIGTLDDQTPIDEVFDTLTFQRITRGSHIGDFETDPAKGYGLTVIIDSSAYTLVLADAQQLDHIIEVTYDTGQPEYADNQQEDIKTKLQREQILSYLDPAAYFGLQGMDKIDLVETTGVTSLQGADDIYSRLLVKFATRDKLYVDIRNEFNYSLNFYGNYGDATAPHDSSVQLLDASGTTVTRTCGTLGWPVLILEQSDFPANSTDEVLPLQLALPVGDNNDPVLYLEGSSFLEDFPDNRLKFRFLTPSGSYTEAFDLGILNNPAQSVVMPGAVKIHLCRRYDTGNLPPVSFPATRIVKNDLLDTLLVQNGLPLTPTPGAVVWNSLSELRYNGWTSHRGIDYTLQTGSARDDIGQVLFAYVKGPAEVDGHTTEAQTHSSLDIDKGKYLAGSFYQYLFNRKVIKPIDIQNIERSSEGNVDCPRILSVKAGFEIDIFQRSANDLITVAFTEAQRTAIEGLLEDFLPGSTKYFVLINHRLTNDDNGFPYYEMELGIQGVDYDDSTFTHEIIRTNTGIWFYSLDGRNYFSENYTAALASQLPYSSNP